MGNSNSTQIDVLLITALKDELDVIREAESDWQPEKDSTGFPYYIRRDIDNSGNEFVIAAARPIDMGGDFASNLATRLVNELKPFCLAMAGICAGWRDEVFLGDVIIAERVFRYDIGKLKAFLKGKEKTEEVFHDIRTYNLNPLWVQKAQDFPSDWIEKINKKNPRPKSYNYQELWLLYKLDEFEIVRGKYPLKLEKEEREKHCPNWPKVLKRLENKELIKINEELKLTDKGKKFISQVKIRNPDGIPPDPEKPKSHVAPMGTGSKVVEDPELFPTISRYMRKVRAVEMEAAAIGTVAEIENVESCIIVKGVSDYGDHDKDDQFRNYAIEGSYRFLMEFLKENLQKKRKHVPFILPIKDIPSFTGREDKLKNLKELLLEQNGKKYCSIVGLTGSGGIGKSALASHFAKLYKTSFPDGIIGLRVDGKNINTIAREFARSVGIEIKQDDVRDASTIMQEVFRHRQALLIFDNAEDSSIKSLLPGGDSCAVIVTTRDRGLPASMYIPLASRIDLPVLSFDEASILLEKLISKSRVQAERESAERIIRLVGNLPLALEIVGATLNIKPWMKIENFANLLHEERNRLKELKYHGDEDLDIRASFMLSLKFLDSNEIDFFSCISVCSKNGFTLQTASAATGCDQEVAEETLSYLYRLSLLNSSQSESIRFVFHPLIYSFAKELALERSLQEIASERHANFFIEFIKSNDLNDPSVSNFVGEEFEEILLAAQWLQSRKLEDQRGQAIALTSLGKVLQRQGNFNEAMSAFKLGAKLEMELGNQHGEAIVLNSLGGVLQRQGNFDEAVDAFKRSAAIEEELCNQHGQAKVLNSLGGVLQRQGNFDEAVDAFKRSYDLLVKLEDFRGQAMVLNSLGGVLQRQGNFDGAVDAFKRSATIEEELGNKRGQAMVLNSLGGVLQRQGNFDEAADAFKRSATIEEELGNKRGQAMVLNSLGGVLQRQGNFDGAVDAFKRSYSISEKLGDERSLAMVLNSMGGVLQRQGNFDEAVDAFKRSYDLLVKLEDLRGQAMVLNSMGGVLQRQGNFDEAVDAFKRSYDLLVKLEDLRGQAMVLNSMGGVLQRQGNFDEAVDAFKRSYDLLVKLEDLRGQAMVLNSMGGVLQRQGNFDEAVDAFKRSYDLLVKLEDLRGQAMVLNSMGGVLQRQGNFDEAVDAFKRSYSISEKLGDERSLAMVLNSLGGVLQRQGNFDEAVDAFKRSYDLLVKLEDLRGQAMVLNSMGGVLQRQGNFDEAVIALHLSIEIGKKLNDKKHLAMAHTTLGRVHLLNRDFKKAAAELCMAFEIEEQIKNRRGIGIVTPMLIKTLLKLDQGDQALSYCQRALAIIPNDKKILKLFADLKNIFRQ